MSEAPGRPGPVPARPPVPGPPRPGPSAPHPVPSAPSVLSASEGPDVVGVPVRDPEVGAAAEVLATLPDDAPPEDVAAALEEVRARLARRLQGTAR